MSNKMSGFFLVVIAAAVGYGMITIPPSVLAQYRSISQESKFLGYAYLVMVAVGSGLLCFSALWLTRRLLQNTRSKEEQRRRDEKRPSEMTSHEKEEEIVRKVGEAENLADDAEAEEQLQLKASTREVKEKLEAQCLEIVAFGTISSGKSSLMNTLVGEDVFHTDARGGTTVTRNEIPWPGVDQVTLVDTPGLGEIEGDAREELARTAARDADVILFVVDGPLKDFEHEVLEQLTHFEKRILLCLNKQDWYTDDDRAKLLDQIHEQVRKWIPQEDVVSVRSRETQRTRIRVTPEGEEMEEVITVEPDVSPLANRMLAVIQKDGRELLLANLLLRSRGLVSDTRERIRASLDKKAREIVEKHAWQAGGASAISPLPVLDVAAGLAISSKMVFELGRVYRQNVDLGVARRLVGELGKNLLATLGASAITPAVSTMVASFLKAVPGIGTLAGGVLQGVTQALVTRWIGAVFIEYFRNEMQEPKGGLAELAREKWKEVTKAAELASAAKVGWQKFGKGKDKV